MKLPETPQAVLYEKQKWEDIITSADWTVYRNALREHVAYQQNQVNIKLREQKFTEAYGLLIAMDDAKKFLDSITSRMMQLNGLSEKGNK